MAEIDAHKDIEYVVELRSMGMAIAPSGMKMVFLYESATWGDSFKGDDVTPNLRAIHQIPLKLETSDKKTRYSLHLRNQGWNLPAK